jgi:hypothetical protein
MRAVAVRVRCLLLIAAFPAVAVAQARDSSPSALRAVALDHVQLVNAKSEMVTYRGRRALQLSPLPGHESTNEGLMAIVDTPEFGDGTIEVELAGMPRTDADTSARGFIGIAFRVDSSATRFECFYLRPTNARADDQLRRNHTAQYVSSPDYTWQRLRAEHPGVYESYTDMEAGAWTKMRIEVRGTTARLFVGAATEPVLIVHDLKLGAGQGRIALWSFAETDGYFTDLKVSGAK